jgi:hypothetical protein
MTFASFLVLSPFSTHLSTKRAFQTFYFEGSMMICKSHRLIVNIVGHPGFRHQNNENIKRAPNKNSPFQTVIETIFCYGFLSQSSKLLIFRINIGGHFGFRTYTIFHLTIIEVKTTLKRIFALKSHANLGNNPISSMYLLFSPEVHAISDQ